MTRDWISDAARRYDACNRESLTWMLERPALQGFIDTKVHALTGEDYTRASGLRGPGLTYGWIQGRGLEALVTFAAHYQSSDPHLAQRLLDRAKALYERLSALYARDGHAFFLYDDALRPIRPTQDGVEPQSIDPSVFTYSDAFVAKGLFAAASQFDPDESAKYLSYLMDAIAAIEDHRFQMDEKRALSVSNAHAEPDDFGPRMILLGAAGLLQRAKCTSQAAFADRFIDDVLTRYFDPISGLLLNIPGDDTCNVGHGIEFCGFAFEYLHSRPNDPRIATLVSVLVRSLELGLQGPGIALSLSAKTAKPVSPYYPWWVMPEAMRACALGVLLTEDARLMALWQRADAAFFTNYWQDGKGYAYQTLTKDGPVDFVPATPDLDPGYHTGLSLLTAIKAKL